MRQRKCIVTTRFTGTRKRDLIEKEFEVGFLIWVDLDQTSDLAEFEIEQNDPWTADREELLRSIRIPD